MYLLTVIGVLGCVVFFAGIVLFSFNRHAECCQWIEWLNTLATLQDKEQYAIPLGTVADWTTVMIILVGTIITVWQYLTRNRANVIASIEQNEVCHIAFQLLIYNEGNCSAFNVNVKLEEKVIKKIWGNNNEPEIFKEAIEIPCLRPQQCIKFSLLDERTLARYKQYLSKKEKKALYLLDVIEKSNDKILNEKDIKYFRMYIKQRNKKEDGLLGVIEKKCKDKSFFDKKEFMEYKEHINEGNNPAEKSYDIWESLKNTEGNISWTNKRGRCQILNKRSYGKFSMDVRHLMGMDANIPIARHIENSLNDIVESLGKADKGFNGDIRRTIASLKPDPIAPIMIGIMKCSQDDKEKKFKLMIQNTDPVNKVDKIPNVRLDISIRYQNNEILKIFGLKSGDSFQLRNGEVKYYDAIEEKKILSLKNNRSLCYQVHGTGTIEVWDERGYYSTLEEYKMENKYVLLLDDDSKNVILGE